MKLFLKKTHSINFDTLSDIPYFYSTFYQKKTNFFLSKTEKEILPLLARKDLKKTTRLLNKLPQNAPYGLKLLKLELALQQEDNKDTSFFEISIPFYAPSVLKAKYLYLKSLHNIYKTDLDQASKDLSLALKIFKKKNHLYECGLCYISLATIYKICGCFDITTTLLLEANKIFTPNFSFPQKRAEIKANLGLNELQYENYDNAILYLNEALDIAKTNNLTTTSSNIINWLALINLIQHKEDNALKILKKSDKTEPCPKHTLLFRHEMFARIYKQQNKLTSSLKHINQALDIATKLKNEREIFELNYLKAEIYFMKNNFLKSTQILNQLITQKHSPNAPYFKANAYTLLGLIAFEKNNFQRAKNLFNISLNLENSKSRTKAIAIDYNNLAEVSLKQKNIHQTLEYLNKALKNAQEINDAELISYLNQKISTLS